MTIEEMREKKKALGYSNEMIAQLSGIPLGTVNKIMSGATKSPRYQAMQALEKVLNPSATGKLSYSSLMKPDDAQASAVHEGGPAYAHNLRKDPDAFIPEESGTEDHRYTIDDYYAFKDEKRRELIDGKLFVMDAPSIKHQMIIGELYVLFRECSAVHGDTCRVLLSPCDVQLDGDRYTMVQPDLLVVCDNEKIRTRRCLGAPDLALEIMSPSSRGRDSILKLNKYMNAGVREFWLVDPENRKVIVYLLNENGEQGNSFFIYSFDDTIPIGISGGECSVDFRVIGKAVEGLAD